MKILLLLFPFMLAQGLCAQTSQHSYAIAIQAKSSATNSAFTIAIDKADDRIKIVYTLKDSVSQEELYKDERYKALLLKADTLFSQQERDKAELLKVTDALDALTKQYTHYRKDSLVFNSRKNAAYTKLLNEVYLSTPEELENKEANRRRIVLDGTMFQFILTSNAGSRVVYAHSPSSDSHPLLSRLIDTTLEVYRQKTGNTFLDKEKTAGY